MPHIDDPLFHTHRGGFVVVIYTYIEGGSADGNYGGRSKDAIRIRLSTPFLNVNLHPPYEQIQKVAKISGIFPKYDIGIRIDFELTSVGNLELRKSVRTSNDNLLDLH